MNRSITLLLVAVLLIAGILALLFLAGSVGGMPALPAETLEAEAGQPSEQGQSGAEEEAQARPDPTERTLLESPLAAVAADPMPTILEGYVRNSSGVGIPGVGVDLIVGRASTEKELYAHRRVLEQRTRLDSVRMDPIPPATKESAGAFHAKKPLGLNTWELYAYHRMGWKPYARCLTDEEGRYRIHPVVLPGGAEALFMAIFPLKGYMPAFPDPIRLEEGHLGPGGGPTLVLHEEGVISGNAVGGQTEGHSITVVRAWLIGETEALDWRKARVSKHGEFLLERLRPGSWRLGLVRSGANQAFTWGPVLNLTEGQAIHGVGLALAPSTFLDVEVFGPGRRPLASRCLLSLRLRSLGPPGEPGAMCTLQEDFHRPSWDTPSWIGEATWLEPGHPFRFGGLVPGRYLVQASMLGPQDMLGVRFPDEEKRIQAFNLAVSKEVELFGPKRVELVFEQAPPLTDVEVRISDRSGAPVVDGNVTIGGKEAKTGPDGIARITGLLPLRHPLSVRAPELFLPKRIELDLSGEPGGALVRKDLVLDQGGVIAGYLLDSGGKGIPLSPVLFGPEDEPIQAASGGFRGIAVTDAQGAFRTRPLAPGRYRIQSRLGDTPEHWRIVAVEEGEATAVELRF